MSKKGILSYLVLVLLIVGAIVWRQRTVTRQRAVEVKTMISEWGQYGKPVEVYKVDYRDVPLYTKVTSWQIAPDVFVGFVSRDVRNKIQVGQEMRFMMGADEWTGTIAYIAEDISLETGLYRVEVRLPRTFNLETWLVARAHTDTLKDVICIPNEVTDIDGDQYYVWKIVDNQAVRQEVTIGRRNGFGAVVTDGLKAGDLVAIRGGSLISEGDKVNILKYVSGKELQYD